MEKNPTVFISYSHDNQKHLDRILELSNNLRGEGIDCILDQYEESPQEGWPRWADRNISEADYVLVICTQTFYNRVMGKEVAGVGHGVIWEGNIIYQHLYNGGTLNKKYIPILFDANDKQFIPTPIGGASFYILQNDYDKLYWRLRGKVKTTKPALGALRKMPEKERKTMFISGLMNMELWDKANWRGIAFLFDEGKQNPPILALLFKEKQYSISIFKEWIERIGNKDIYEEIRVSIVEGDVEGLDYGYFIHIGGNFKNIDSRLKEQYKNANYELFMISSRFFRVYLTGEPKNLKRFKDLYSKFKCYYLVPSILKDDGSIETNENNYIFKRSIELRDYKDIKDDQDFDYILNKWTD